MTDIWLTSLKVADPQSGYDLAIKLSRMAVKLTQPDPAVREDLRAVYETDANALIQASLVVATHFQTIAIANNHWRD